MGNPLDQFDAQPASGQGNPLDQFDTPSATASNDNSQQGGGFWNNVKAGLAEVPGAIAMMLANSNPDAMPFERDDAADVGPKVNRKVGKVTGFQPESVPEVTVGDMLGRNLGGALPFMAIDPAMEAGAVVTGAKALGKAALSAGRTALTGLGAVAGQTAAQAAAPNSPAVQTVGALLGALATGKLTQAPGAIRRAMTTATPEEQASQYVSDVAQSAGATPDTIAKAQTDAQGKPIIGAEAIGRPGINATRTLGLRQGTTGDALQAQLTERAEGQGGRVLDDFSAATGVDPAAARGDIQAVVDQGQEDAAPLYKEAFAGGSSAPFESVLTDQFNIHSKEVKTAQTAINDASNAMTLAESKVDAAGDNVYLRNSALHERAAAQKQMDTAQTQLDQSTQAKDAVKERLQQAQSDKENGVKGGVWSPYLERLLQNHNIKKGLARGFAIERDKADAANVAFNPTDHAITGTDADGNPIIKGVPTMQVLDMGKRGLDSVINDYKDPKTGFLNTRDPRVQALMDLKKSYLGELDKLNPDYKAARAKASDYLGAEDSFNRAQKMFSNPNVTNQQFQEFLGGLGDTDKEAAKGGVANWIYNQAENGRLTGKTFSKPILQKKLTGIVANPEKAATFLLKMNAEKTMAQSGNRMMPGVNSTTAESIEAGNDQDRFGAAMSGAKALHSLTEGHPIRAAIQAGAAATKMGVAYAKSPFTSVPFRDAAGKLFMMPPEELSNQLRAYQASEMAKKLSRSKFPVRGMLPAISPALNQNSYLSGNNQ